MKKNKFIITIVCALLWQQAYGMEDGIHQFNTFQKLKLAWNVLVTIKNGASYCVSSKTLTGLAGVHLFLSPCALKFLTNRGPQQSLYWCMDPASQTNSLQFTQSINKKIRYFTGVIFVGGIAYQLWAYWDQNKQLHLETQKLILENKKLITNLTDQVSQLKLENEQLHEKADKKLNSIDEKTNHINKNLINISIKQNTQINQLNDLQEGTNNIVSKQNEHTVELKNMDTKLNDLSDKIPTKSELKQLDEKVSAILASTKKLPLTQRKKKRDDLKNALENMVLNNVVDVDKEEYETLKEKFDILDEEIKNEEDDRLFKQQIRNNMNLQLQQNDRIENNTENIILSNQQERENNEQFRKQMNNKFDQELLNTLEKATNEIDEN